MLENINRFFCGCPAINARRFLIINDGKPVASFDLQDDANKALAMYKTNVRSVRVPSKNSTMSWEIKDQGAR